MSTYEQPVTTYSDQTAHARVISDVVQMIDPRDTPLLSRLGLDGARNKFNIKLNGYKIELLEDELDPLETTANNGTTIGAADTSFTVTDASVFQDGHVILIDAEYMVVKAANQQTNEVEVYSRSYGERMPRMPRMQRSRSWAWRDWRGMMPISDLYLISRRRITTLASSRKQCRYPAHSR